MTYYNGSEQRRHKINKNDICCGSVIFFIIFCIIGLGTYLYGCNEYVGGWCSRYSLEDFHVTDSGVFARGNVFYDGVNNRCKLETGRSFANDYSARRYYNDHYPVNSTHEIQYDHFEGNCKTVGYTSNLAIVGFFFLIMVIVVICVGMWCMYLEKQRFTQEDNTRRAEYNRVQQERERTQAAELESHQRITREREQERERRALETATAKNLALTHEQLNSISDIESGAYIAPSVPSVPTRNPLDKFKRKYQAEKPSCAICKDEFEEGDDCLEFACKHSFHEYCGKKWFDEKPVCPLCNGNLVNQV